MTNLSITKNTCGGSSSHARKCGGGCTCTRNCGSDSSDEEELELSSSSVVGGGTCTYFNKSLFMKINYAE
jgi:hypothetical protein